MRPVLFEFGLRWDLDASRWRPVGKSWYPDDRPRSSAWTQVLTKIGAVPFAGARGVWLAVWQGDDDSHPTVATSTPFPKEADAVEHALNGTRRYYANKFDGDYDLRVVHFKRADIEGLQYATPRGYDPVPLPRGTRSRKFFSA